MNISFICRIWTAIFFRKTITYSRWKLLVRWKNRGKWIMAWKRVGFFDVKCNSYYLINFHLSKFTFFRVKHKIYRLFLFFLSIYCVFWADFCDNFGLFYWIIWIDLQKTRKIRSLEKKEILDKKWSFIVKNRKVRQFARNCLHNLSLDLFSFY